MLQQTEAISEESCHTNGEAEGCLRLQKPLVKRLLFDPHVTARQEQDENVNSKRSPPPHSSRFIILIDLRHSGLN